MRLFAFLLFLCLSFPATAHVVHEDLGGPIDKYQGILAKMLETKEPLAIDGECTSACTIVALGLPRNQVCVTPNAMLGFHLAYMATQDEDGNVVPDKRDAAGFPVGDVKFTASSITKYYPAAIHAWIKRHGGLHAWVIYLRMPELGRYMRPCT